MNQRALKTLAGVALALSLCGSVAHAKDAPAISAAAAVSDAPPPMPKVVQFDITVKRDGKIVSNSLVNGFIGDALTTLAGNEQGTPCTFTGAMGQKTEFNAPLENQSALTILPATEDNGELTAILMISESQATPGNAAVFKGCPILTGTEHFDRTVVSAVMHVGTTRTVALNPNVTVDIKLSGIRS